GGRELITTTPPSPDQPAAIVTAANLTNHPSGNAVDDAGENELIVQEHPITRGVDWNRMWSEGSLRSAGSPPPDAAWQSEVRTAEYQILVAVQAGRVRQVWLNFDSTAVARSPQFVFF